MDIRKLFTDGVVQAILRRKEKVNKTVIIVSKLMEAYGMSEYTRTAEKLILAKEACDKFLQYHVTLDFLTGDIWLDEIALHYYSDILTRFIDEKQFEAFTRYIEGVKNVNRIHNQAIQMYREKSVIKLFKDMHYHNKFKKSLPEEVKMIKIWSLLELFSRTPFPKVYYFFKELPMFLKVKYISHSIKGKLLAEMQQ